MIFTLGTIFKTGIIIYILLWVYFKCRIFILLQRQPYPSAKKIDYLFSICSFIRLFGWLVPILLLLFSSMIFPTVKIVTKSNSNNYSIDRYYVPFYYKGEICEPTGCYLSNETDEDLILYPTYFSLGNYLRTETIKIKTLKAHSFIHFNKNIDNKFTTPYESFYKYKIKNGEYQWIEWTIDTKSGFEYSQKQIKEALKQRELNTKKSRIK